MQTIANSSTRTSSFPLSRSSAEIVKIVRLNDGIARSDIQTHTLLAQQTIHRLTADLVDKQLLALHEPKIDGRGKPSPQLKLNGAGAYATSVAINTDAVEISHIDFAGNSLSHSTLDVNPNRPDDVIESAYAEAQLQRDKLNLDSRRFGGVGVSMHGFRNSRAGSFSTPIPLLAWANVPISEKFNEKFGPQVYVENNATLGAIAESWLGAGRQHKTLIYLSLNHGFGGGLILNGEPFFGAHGNAGEMSAIYTPTQLDDRPALSKLLEVLKKNGIDINSVSELSTHFDVNWPGVGEWVERVTPALNLLIRGLTAIVDPDAIVFGGQAPTALKELLSKVCVPRGPDRHGRHIPGPQFIVSTLSTDPSMVGAGINALRCRVLGT